MKKFEKIIILIMIPLMSIVACKKDEPKLDSAPTAADAGFSYQASMDSENILTFSSNNKAVVAIWDFGNGTEAKGSVVTAQYPNKGDYTVKLTVFTNGGSTNSSQVVNIVNDDLTLLKDTLFTLLTGGIDSLFGKTWVVDSTTAAHFGVGPNPTGAAGDFPEYFAAPPNDKAGAGMYDDRYIFKLDAFKFDMITKGEVFIDDAQGAGFPGSTDLSPDKIAPFPDQIGESWSITKGADTTITITGRAFLGHYTGTHVYKVIRLTENELFVSFEDSSDPSLLWYVKLIPAGYDSGAGGGGGGGGSTGFSLPMDFETVEPVFTGFGNSSAIVIDNPGGGFGINTSSRVLQTIHGNEVWSGLSVELDSKLDFSTNGKISIKVFSNFTGVFRVKLEDKSDNSIFTEVDVNIVSTNNWAIIEADFSAAASGTYDKLVLFPGYGVVSTNEYLIDDIIQNN